MQDNGHYKNKFIMYRITDHVNTVMEKMYQSHIAFCMETAMPAIHSFKSLIMMMIGYDPVIKVLDWIHESMVLSTAGSKSTNIFGRARVDAHHRNFCTVCNNILFVCTQHIISQSNTFGCHG